MKNIDSFDLMLIFAIGIIMLFCITAFIYYSRKLFKTKGI
jgi:hypothetical protein